jgi:hypothetical protein
VIEVGAVLPYALAAVAVVALWAAILSHLDVFTPADVHAWHRLAALRGYAPARGRLERAAARVPMLRRIQDELDLPRLIGVAGRNETAAGFLLRSLFLSLLSCGLCLTALVVALVQTGGWPLPPAVALLLAGLVFLLQVSWLRSSARAHRDQAGTALGDMLMLVAILTDGRGLQLEDAVRILSRSADHRALQTIVDNRGWERLVEGPHRSTIHLYRLIAEAYGIPLFATVADAAANANLGFSERQIYTRLAGSVYQQRLAEARFHTARAKMLVTLPIAGMLIPLIVLIAAPVFASITGGLGSG